MNDYEERLRARIAKTKQRLHHLEVLHVMLGVNNEKHYSYLCEIAGDTFFDLRKDENELERIMSLPKL